MVLLADLSFCSYLIFDKTICELIDLLTTSCSIFVFTTNEWRGVKRGEFSIELGSVGSGVVTSCGKILFMASVQLSVNVLATMLLRVVFRSSELSVCSKYLILSVITNFVFFRLLLTYSFGIQTVLSV